VKKQVIHTAELTEWRETVGKLVSASGFVSMVRGDKPVLIKPNLVTADKPPITTPLELCAALCGALRAGLPGVRIIVAEGCGSLDYDTAHVFKKLGYTRLAEDFGAELLDLNSAECVKISRPECKRFPEMWLPKILFESFVISVPVLKAHSMAGVTLSMKNMMGCAPPKHYNAGGWQKSAFHTGMQEAVFDLNRYRAPDFSVLDATVGMSEAHLWGPICEPQPNIVAFCADPVAIDAFGASLLRKNPSSVGHIKMADGVLGFMRPGKIVRL
jgi:uncharacterized protein (DUF362 family)